jgi:hypothetical protein
MFADNEELTEYMLSRTPPTLRLCELPAPFTETVEAFI